jgi:polysaccharide export outer membrane protein
MEVDLWDSVWSQDQGQPVVSNALQILLRDGDAIHVPQMAADSNLDQRLMARSSLAPPTVRVRVVGEVRRPGEIQLPPDGTLSSAIASAGGPTRDGALQRVEYIRLNEAGEVERQQIDLANLTDDIQVQDGDVLFVPQTNLSTFAYTTSQALSPFFGLLNLFGRANSLFD